MAGSWFERIKKTFENTFHPAHAVAGLCSSPNLTQMKDLLEHAEKLTKRAKYSAAFANSVGALGDAGEKLSGAVEELNSLTEKSKTIIGDANAACEISDAVSVLNNWNMPNSSVSNEEAAKAFDCGAWLKAAAAERGGRGGGRPERAEGRLKLDALESLESLRL